MTDPKTTPGIARINRISDEGLQRLELMLARGREFLHAFVV